MDGARKSVVSLPPLCPRDPGRSTRLPCCANTPHGDKAKQAWVRLDFNYRELFNQGRVVYTSVLPSMAIPAV